jgi:hypothetical protein
MPGDRQMLDEFLSTLSGDRLEALMRKAWHVPADQKVRATPQMANALAKLVRTVWDEMELAGEAGSLLKIEETLRDAISTARKETEEKSPLFRVLEYGVTIAPKARYMQLVSGEDQDFFDRSEGLVLAALRDYTEQAKNDAGYRRRLFSGDAIEGFAFIDLSRKRYDVVVMNPPFGEFTVKADNKRFSNGSSSTDIFTAFILRGLDFLAAHSIVGAITSRTWLSLSSFRKFRELLLKNKIVNVIDLGRNVLDDANVQVCAYCVEKN